MPTKVARIRNSNYQKHKELFQSKSVPIDVLINPEDEVTDYTKIIEFGAMQVLDFAGGKVRLVTQRLFTRAISWT